MSRGSRGARRSSLESRRATNDDATSIERAGTSRRNRGRESRMPHGLRRGTLRAAAVHGLPSGLRNEVTLNARRTTRRAGGPAGRTPNAGCTMSRAGHAGRAARAALPGTTPRAGRAKRQSLAVAPREGSGDPAGSASRCWPAWLRRLTAPGQRDWPRAGARCAPWPHRGKEGGRVD